MQPTIIFVISKAQTVKSYHSASLRKEYLRNVFGVEFSRGNLPLVKFQIGIIGRIKIFINWTDPISRIKVPFRYHHYEQIYYAILFLKEARPESSLILTHLYSNLEYKQVVDVIIIGAKAGFSRRLFDLVLNF